MIKLLLIEDDTNLGYIIKTSLEEIIGGYDISLASNAKEGLGFFRETSYDIIVSDVEMPEMNGFEMVQIMRQTDKNIPIIFASAKISPKDVTTGFTSGGNNYIKKPFLPEELDAYIKALLNLTDKSGFAAQTSSDIYHIGTYIFDAAHYSLIYNNEKHQLTQRETEILKLLCDNKSDVVKRQDILLKYWGTDDYFVSRSLDVFISKMRKYFSNDESVILKTIKGVGFIFDY